ncbi:hypothetical protein BATDEDRAFT_27499 [Batrachochytrium dendrobatidis JAM81]|uniref:Ubiquitin-like protease family profile domain-containing protein n=1 Tax=Batrachochytrium dendrobatidis (strain JAM81 / FGSC 10211) TaxID=684364 RepID=F4PB16_BATDJ|nr:uncharacterized protein BATDEDRAFT_27499 [Batrachochytrium dendrobatidis JAM81]EGF77776.1 hypothetical protein BATDEDRAFT_27499 [Batrachochytrium dendrobatidis JAM81]|eukprot:XP_006681688.1 hypothetical protein BATDEDRAFT_27499 [Batrachochytrium dendrobatidis JAM81]
MSVILSYGDVQVTDEDLATLLPSEWIGDGIIQFYYEFLEHTVCKSREILLIQPAVAHLIACSVDKTYIKAALPPNINSKSTIFIPINDSNGSQNSGCHWSLMCYYRPTNSYYYYDSMGNANIRSAKQTMNSICGLIGSSSPAFIAINTPMQVNGYDCGVYVMAITELLCNRMASKHSHVTDEPESLSFWQITHCIPPHFISEKRNTIRNLIIHLAGSKPQNQQ